MVSGSNPIDDQIEMFEDALNKMRKRSQRTKYQTMGGLVLLVAAAVSVSVWTGIVGVGAGIALLIAGMAATVWSHVGVGANVLARPGLAASVLLAGGVGVGAVDAVVLDAGWWSATGVAGGVLGAVFAFVGMGAVEPMDPLPAEYRAFLNRLPVDVADDPVTGMTVVVLPSTVSVAVGAAPAVTVGDPTADPAVLSFANRISHLRRTMDDGWGLVFGGVCIVEGYEGDPLQVAPGVWCTGPNRIGAGLDAVQTET